MARSLIRQIQRRRAINKKRKVGEPKRILRMRITCWRAPALYQQAMYARALNLKIQRCAAAGVIDQNRHIVALLVMLTAN